MTTRRIVIMVSAAIAMALFQTAETFAYQDSDSQYTGSPRSAGRISQSLPDADEINSAVVSNKNDMLELIQSQPWTKKANPTPSGSDSVSRPFSVTATQATSNAPLSQAGTSVAINAIPTPEPSFYAPQANEAEEAPEPFTPSAIAQTSSTDIPTAEQATIQTQSSPTVGVPISALSVKLKAAAREKIAPFIDQWEALRQDIINAAVANELADPSLANLPVSQKITDEQRQEFWDRHTKISNAFTSFMARYSAGDKFGPSAASVAKDMTKYLEDVLGAVPNQ